MCSFHPLFLFNPHCPLHVLLIIAFLSLSNRFFLAILRSTPISAVSNIIFWFRRFRAGSSLDAALLQFCKSWAKFISLYWGVYVCCYSFSSRRLPYINHNVPIAEFFYTKVSKVYFLVFNLSFDLIIERKYYRTWSSQVTG